MESNHISSQDLVLDLNSQRKDRNLSGFIRNILICALTKVLWGWNDMKVSKCWHFLLNYPCKVWASSVCVCVFVCRGPQERCGTRRTWSCRSSRSQCSGCWSCSRTWWSPLRRRNSTRPRKWWPNWRPKSNSWRKKIENWKRSSTARTISTSWRSDDGFIRFGDVGFTNLRSNITESTRMIFSYLGYTDASVSVLPAGRRRSGSCNREPWSHVWSCQERRRPAERESGGDVWPGAWQDQQDRYKHTGLAITHTELLSCTGSL